MSRILEVRTRTCKTVTVHPVMNTTQAESLEKKAFDAFNVH